jgi:hypothetical protein
LNQHVVLNGWQLSDLISRGEPIRDRPADILVSFF